MDVLGIRVPWLYDPITIYFEYFEKREKNLFSQRGLSGVYGWDGQVGGQPSGRGLSVHPTRSV